MSSAVHPVAYAVKTATVSNAAKAISHADFGFTADQLAAADHAIISVNAEGVFATWEGTDPTTSLGHYLAATHAPFVVRGRNVANLKFIRAGSNDATVSITLEKY